MEKAKQRWGRLDSECYRQENIPAGLNYKAKDPPIQACNLFIFFLTKSFLWSLLTQPVLFSYISLSHQPDLLTQIRYGFQPLLQLWIIFFSPQGTIYKVQSSCRKWFESTCPSNPGPRPPATVPPVPTIACSSFISSLCEIAAPQPHPWRCGPQSPLRPARSRTMKCSAALFPLLCLVSLPPSRSLC